MYAGNQAYLRTTEGSLRNFGKIISTMAIKSKIMQRKQLIATKAPGDVFVCDCMGL